MCVCDDGMRNQIDMKFREILTTGSEGSQYIRAYLTVRSLYANMLATTPIPIIDTNSTSTIVLPSGIRILLKSSEFDESVGSVEYVTWTKHEH